MIGIGHKFRRIKNSERNRAATGDSYGLVGPDFGEFLENGCGGDVGHAGVIGERVSGVKAGKGGVEARTNSFIPFTGFKLDAGG